jgi:choline dehydrogenase
MFWLRGDLRDYQPWQDAGGPQWGPDAMLRAFRELERFNGKPSPYRGTSGLLSNGQLPSNHPMAKLFVEAGKEAGLKENHDFNGAQIEGIGYYDLNIDGGRRISAAHAFLLPVLSRRNLTLLTDAKVLRLVMNGRKCKGVELRHNAANKTYFAKEVILSAGAVNSPEILLRSGIGPADELKKIEISSVCDLPAVGRNLVDHVMVLGTSFETKDKTSPPSGNGGEAHAVWKSDPTLSVADTQLIFSQVPSAADLPMDRGYSLLVGLVRPTSVGSLRLQNSDPDSAPLIDPNYLAEEADMRRLLLSMELTREIGNSNAFADVRKREVLPGKLAKQEMRRFIAEHCATYWHAVGTCRMGTGEESVVDPSLRVHGTEGLRVVDASVMPRITTLNTNAPTMMIAHKAAEIIS